MISRIATFRALQKQSIAAASLPTRAFGAKKRTRKSDTEASASEVEEESEPVPTPEPTKKAAPKATPQAAPVDPNEHEFVRRARMVQTFAAVPKHLFTEWSAGDLPQIESVPGDKPPASEDTIEGRYAYVLFTTASQNKALYAVYEDMKYLSELYKHCEPFRSFTENQGVGTKDINALNAVLKETAPFTETTLRFLSVLADNKRLSYIKQISQKYERLYQLQNREEKITIISAATLNSEQQNKVLAALQANP